MIHNGLSVDHNPHYNWVGFHPSNPQLTFPEPAELMLHEVVLVDGRKLSLAWFKTDEFADCSVGVWMFFMRISFIGNIQDGFWV